MTVQGKCLNVRVRVKGIRAYVCEGKGCLRAAGEGSGCKGIRV